MYTIMLGPVEYDRWRDGRPFTLVEALREVYGVGEARVLRADGTVVVRNAGSAYVIEYAPTGRRIMRRKVQRRS